MMQIIYQVLVLGLILLMPGLLVTLVLFKKEEIGWVLRLGLSFAFSVMIVSVEILGVGLLGVRLNQSSVLLQIDLVLLVVVLVIYIRRNANKR